jgi:hypothetical protein
MMLYGRVVHLFPFLAVALLEACGGSTTAQTTALLPGPAIAVGEPHPQPTVSVRDFELLPFEPGSGITKAQNVVIRDSAALGTLWAAHMGNYVPVPPMPKIDFNEKMLVGVFVGQLTHGCGTANIHHLRNEGAKVTVAYSVSTAAPEVCAAVMGSPAALAIVDRSDAPVEFTATAGTDIPLATIDHSQVSGVHTARNAIVKDQAAWEALWAEHHRSTVAPSVDFTRNMVVAAFNGPGDGCAGISLASALRSGPVVTIRRKVTVPGPEIACTKIATSPAHMVVMEKTSDQVVFANETVVRR